MQRLSNVGGVILLILSLLLLPLALKVATPRTSHSYPPPQIWQARKPAPVAPTVLGFEGDSELAE